ncbi:MAG: hypothetical protein ABIH66_06625 [bacterium]
MTSFIIGFVFPLGSELYRSRSRDAARGVGWLYVCESLGFMIGGLIFTFVYAGRFNSFFIVYVSCILLLAAFLALVVRSKMGAVAGAAALIAFAAGSYSVLDESNEKSVAARWKSISPATRLVETVDTKYENVSVSVYEGQYSVFGNGGYLFSFPDRYYYAAKAHFLLAEHPAPGRVLVLGEGAMELACEMLLEPVDALDYVALDRELMDAVLPYMDEATRKCLDDPRLRVVHTDGRFFVRSANRKYDFIFVESGGPSTAARNRYFTLEFLREARAALREGGAFAISMEASENLLFGVAGMQSASLYRTIGEVFAHVVVIPGETHYFFASAAPGVVTARVAELSRRYTRRDVRTEYFHPAMFETLVQPRRLREVEETLKKKEGVRTNTDGNPAAYFYNLVLWLSTLEAGGKEAPGGAAFLKAAERYGMKVILAVMIVFFAAAAFRLTSRRYSPRHRLAGGTAGGTAGGALLSVFLCGGAAMSFEMLLIFGYQNLFGVLFERIALVTGIFMFGIACGAALANALLRGGRSPVAQVKIIHALFALFGLFALFMMEQLRAGYLAGGPHSGGPVLSQFAFSAVVFLCGLLTGWIFPVACSLHLEGGGEVGRTAGRVDSLDHLGAAGGAFLAGAFIIPVFGVHILGGLLIAVNVAALGLWFILAKGHPG